jgi:lipopolysaccharide biosynthesis glycosyltransferase
MIEYALTHKCDLVDQDVLNFFCQNRVTFIDGRWNVDVNTMALDVVKDAPSDVYELYLRNLENAYIYHFAGVEKPWINPSLEFAHIFWRIARKTPFYEMMMVEIIRNNIQSLPPLNSTISEEMILIMMNKNAVYIQYYKYKLLSKITLGEKRRRYKEKRKYFHEKVRQIRLYFKLYINANSR